MDFFFVIPSASYSPTFVVLISIGPPTTRSAGSMAANGASGTAGLWSVIRGKSAPSLLQLIKDGADVQAVGGVRQPRFRPHAHTPTLRGSSPCAAQGDQTPLHLACELDAGECVKVLIAHNADLRAEDGQLRTPLLLACELGAAGSATLLMDAGASLAATDKTDKTPLHWLSQHGCAEALTLALRKGAGQRDVRVGV